MNFGLMIPRIPHGEKPRTRSLEEAACRQRSRASLSLRSRASRRCRARCETCAREPRFALARPALCLFEAADERGLPLPFEATGPACVPHGAGAAAGWTERARACSSGVSESM